MKMLKEKAKRKEAKEKVKRKSSSSSARAREEVGGSVDLESIEYNDTAFALGIIRSDLKFAAEKIGMTAEEVNAWLKYMDEVDWTFATGRKISYRNFRRSLRMWHKTEEKMREARADTRTAVAQKELETKKMVAAIEKAKTDPSMWALCRERCANASECGCKRGVRIPPDRRLPRPCAPEECSTFTPILGK